MSNELSSQEKAELTSGGPCNIHYHEILVSHQLLERLQDQYRVVQVNANYSAALLDDIILCNTSGGNVTVTLPYTLTQKEYTVARTTNDANVVVINFSNGMTIYGYASFTLTYFAQPIKFKVYNGNWILV